MSSQRGIFETAGYYAGIGLGALGGAQVGAGVAGIAGGAIGGAVGADLGQIAGSKTGKIFDKGLNRINQSLEKEGQRVKLRYDSAMNELQNRKDLSDFEKSRMANEWAFAGSAFANTD